jgi:ureidoglycolate hydrolase
MSATELQIVDLTPEAFAPFGTVGVPLGDGAHGAGDVALDLSQGRPRFYIMRLIGRGLSFDRMARHDRVTQCLGTTDGLPWLVVVSPATSSRIRPAKIRSVVGPTFSPKPHITPRRLISTSQPVQHGGRSIGRIGCGLIRNRHHTPPPPHFCV